MPFERQHTGSSLSFPVFVENTWRGLCWEYMAASLQTKDTQEAQITEHAESVIKDWAPTAPYQCDPGHMTLPF